MRRRHPGYFVWLAVALIMLCWGAKQRFFLPLDPLADGDCYGYLNPALSKLTGGGFEHSTGREFLYPAFVFLNLCVFGDFRAITICQHLAGLATAGVMLLAWQQLLALRRGAREAADGMRGFFVAAAWQTPAFVGAAVYLGCRPVFLAEHTIRPESLFSFGAALSLWMNLRFIRLRWREARPVEAWKLGAVHLFLSCVLFLLRPSFAFGVVFINLPLLAALGGRGEPWAAKWRPVVVAMVGAILLLFLPEAILRRDDRLAVTLLPSMRFFAHANLILPQLDADLAAGRPLPYDRAGLQAVRDRLASTLEASRRPKHAPWPRLGFNPDYMYAQKTVFEPLFPEGDPATDRPLARFCNGYCVRMALHHPLAMAGKVFTQLTFFYSFKPTMHFAKDHLHSFEKFRRGLPRVHLDDPLLYPQTAEVSAYPSFRQRFEISDMGRAFLKRSDRLARSPKAVAQAAILQWLDDLLKAAYPPLLLLGLAACAAVWRVRVLREALALNAWATLLLFSYNLGASLTIATVFYLGQSRYLDMQKAFTLFSELAGLALLIQCAAVLRRGASEIVNEPDDGSQRV